jgi:hypothetical protein
MMDQPNDLTTIARREANILPAAARRPWRTPRVIEGTLDDAESGGIVNGDAGSLS